MNCSSDVGPSSPSIRALHAPAQAHELGKRTTGRFDLAITCGIDWAETHHDVALVDESGKLVAKRRISDDAEGYRRLLQLLAEAGDTAQDPIPVAVETARNI